MEGSPPNVVLVVLDSVRRDHLSCYGYTRHTTPNIDRIAAEGLLFDKAYAASCWTIPSHASLFTGLYPSEHRTDLDTRYLPTRHRTLAEYLRQQGYRTACITCNGFLSEATNLNSGFDITIDADRLRGGTRGMHRRMLRGLHRVWRTWTGRDRGARRATDLASRWLDRQQRGNPFFLFLNYMDCHLPYRLRTEDRYRFANGADREQLDRIPQDPFASMAGALTLSREDIAQLETIYDGALYHLDRQIGRLDACLRRLGMADDTVFLITADHGESFGEHGLLDHQYGLYENLISVPLIARLPGGERKGERYLPPVQLVDIFPTVAHLLDGRGRNTPVPPMSGRSLFRDPPRDAVIAEYLVPNLRPIKRRFPDADVSRFDIALRSIRVGEFKLIRRSDGSEELYNLATDPGERINLASIRVDVVAQLGARLESSVGDWPRTAPEAVENETVFAEVRDRLEALGYL